MSIKKASLFLLLVVITCAPLAVAHATACFTNSDCTISGQTCDTSISTCVTASTNTGSAASTNSGSAASTNNGSAASTNTGGTTATDGTTLVNPLKSITDLPSLLKVILQAIVNLGSILLTVMLVYVGFKFVLAQGNEEKISDARNALLWTVIGGLILLGATAIQTVITSTVNGL